MKTEEYRESFHVNKFRTQIIWTVLEKSSILFSEGAYFTLTIIGKINRLSQLSSQNFLVFYFAAISLSFLIQLEMQVRFSTFQYL